MPIDPALMHPGTLTVDVTFAMRPEPAASADEPLHVLVDAHADTIKAAARQLEQLADGGFIVEDLTDRHVGEHRPTELHYAAYAECEDILTGLAALQAAGASISHVQYATAAGHYEVDAAQLTTAEPSR